jgi:hypothetical protein
MMADFTQTVTNSLSVLAASPGTEWNDFNWGEQNWGQDEDLWTDTGKWLSENLYLTVALHKDFVKSPISETITLTEDLSSLSKSIGIWDYVFTKPTVEGQDKVFDESSKVSDADTAWSDVSEASSTWSDV